MDISFAGAAILVAAAPAPAAVDSPKPAATAPAPTASAPSGEKAENVKCSEGRLPKRLGGQPWILNVCDRATLIVSADEGNPAKPFLFFLIPHRGGHRYAGLTIQFPDRSVTPPMPAAAAAARDELLALSADEMAALIAAVRKPGEVLPPAPDYDEQWIGAWRIRTDRKARSFNGIVWSETGVIELSAMSLDGKAKLDFHDNGRMLSGGLKTPACAAGFRAGGYEGKARSKRMPAHFLALARTLCVRDGYEAEIRSWIPGFPAALRAMKARAEALYGPNPARCVEPEYDADRVPPPHPVCGFPPPRIGEDHYEVW